jgi:hypothetical protein
VSDLRSLYIWVFRQTSRVFERLGLLEYLDRHASKSRRILWFRSLLSIGNLRSLVELDVPWWSLTAADAVDHFLGTRPDAKVFEWGSGASTFWLARRSAKVVSVEHDPEWARAIQESLPNNVTLHLIQPATTSESSSEFQSGRAGFTGLDFSSYVRAIETGSDSFDLIVIDGRARQACMHYATKHLAPGGLIVFDNARRRRYRPSLLAIQAKYRIAYYRGATPALPYPTTTALITQEPAC